MILKNIPDENLMESMEHEREPSGVNIYPVMAIWNSLPVGIIVGHSTIESLRRELLRNPALCEVCDFDINRGSDAVPSTGCYSRFIKKLIKLQPLLQDIFQTLLTNLQDLLPDFGETLAIDGKGLSSFGRQPGKNKDD